MLVLPPVVFLALAAVFVMGMAREDPEALPSALAGKGAPVLALSPLGGRPVPDDAVLRAPGVKLVNFWASWCAPCRAEHPILTELAAQGIPIHGINYKDQPAQAESFLAELGNPFATVGADTTGRNGIDWGLYGVPETFVIDGQGRIVLRYPGPVTRQELERKIMPAIAAARAAGG